MKPKSPEARKKQINDRPAVGVGVLVWRGDHLLLGQRIDSQGSNVWQFPGGHLEAGESVLECAVREVLEETGLVANFAQHADFSNETFSMNGREYVTLYVSAASLSGDPRVMEPDKCRIWQWFPCNQLPSPLFLPITNFLKQAPDLSVYKIGADTLSIERK